MKYKQLSQLPATELEKKQAELHVELMKLHSQSSTGSVSKNPHQIKQIKKTMARIKTIQKTKK